MMGLRKLIYGHGIIILISSVVSFFLVPYSLAQGTELADRRVILNELRQLVADHNDVKAAEHDLRALELNLNIFKKQRWPILAVTGGVGREGQENPGITNDTILNPQDLNIKATIPVINFSIPATIHQLDLSLEQGKLAKRVTETVVLLQGISAQVNLFAARKALEYAEKSVTNIRKQTELENARVTQGSGLTSDLLQAKSQLAGANARTTSARGAYQQAVNRYLAVFKKIPEEELSLEEMRIPSDLMPLNSDDALTIAEAESPQIFAERLSFDIAKSAVNIARSASLFPTIDFFVEGKYKKNFSGATGFERDVLAKFELTYNFNTAGSGFDSLKLAKVSRDATASRYDQSKLLIEEQVRNSWSQYELAQINAAFLNDQADLVSGFLELARKEYELGQRTLLEVLAGETNQFNAASDAISARAQELIAGYTILAIIGRLDTTFLN